MWCICVPNLLVVAPMFNGGLRTTVRTTGQALCPAKVLSHLGKQNLLIAAPLRYILNMMFVITQTTRETIERSKMGDYGYPLQVLPQHGVNGGYFAIDVLPASWATLENMKGTFASFYDDPDYIAHCKNLEFAVPEESFFLWGASQLLFAREMFDPNFFANKLSREAWSGCGPVRKIEFEPYDQNFYSMQIISEIRDICLQRAQAEIEAAGGNADGNPRRSTDNSAPPLALFYTEVAERFGAMLELDWDKYIVCFCGP